MTTELIHPALAQTPAAELLDARHIPCVRKHPLILERADQLPVGASFVLVNGHAPEPLRYQFEALFPACFRWDYLVNENEFAAVRITRLCTTPADAPGLRGASAPQSCGHHHA